MSEPEYLAALVRCSDAARTCYKSESKGFEDDIRRIKQCITVGHESVLEHYSLSVRFICDRGISHEIVRHRLASFSQESTRYANYSKDKFGNEITLIRPCFWNKDSTQYGLWEVAMRLAENTYLAMLENGAKPEQARSVLPNSLKTEIVVTANIREWRHILKLRTAQAAHPQIRELMVPLLFDFQKRMPVFFEDIKIKGVQRGKENEENKVAKTNSQML